MFPKFVGDILQSNFFLTSNGDSKCANAQLTIILDLITTFKKISCKSLTCLQNVLVPRTIKCIFLLKRCFNQRMADTSSYMMKGLQTERFTGDLAA